MTWKNIDIPKDIEAECNVLGGILNNNQALIEVVKILQPSDFYKTNNRIIYNCMVKLYEQNTSVDITTMTNQLGAEVLSNIGGITYLSQLFSSVIGTNNIIDHVKIVKDKSIRRQLIKESRKVEKLAFAEGTASNLILNNLIQNLNNINQPAKSKPWYKTNPKNGNIKVIPGILARHLTNNIPAVYSAEQFLVYEDGAYRPSSDHKASSVIKKHINDELVTSSLIDNTKNLWKYEILKDTDELNKNPNILNVKNGLLDINTMELKPHTKDYLTTIQLNVTYNPDKKCPNFLKFIKQALDEETVLIAQEIMGYMLTPLTDAQKSFVLVGKARTGKSTFLRVVESILQKENIAHVSWQALEDKFTPAELYGKLANIFADLPNKPLEDAGFFKTLTGEDPITVQRKFGQPFAFQNKARLLFSCNELPKNYADRTDGFYRRLLMLSFNNVVPVNKIDTKLNQKIENELDGVFNWALEGLQRLIKNKFVFSSSKETDRLLEEYKLESNSVLQFVQEECILGNQYCVPTSQLYSAYKKFSEDSGVINISKQKFKKELLKVEGVKSPIKIHDGSSRKTNYLGIGLVEDTRTIPNSMITPKIEEIFPHVL